MPELVIVAVEYLEPEYKQTLEILKDFRDVVFIDRKGTGSLAKAYNDGFKFAKKLNPEFVWFISNITFEKDTPKRLIQTLKKHNADVVHPEFASDHIHLREGEGVQMVPFVEFTAPMVRVSTHIELDENCPYWGHDLIHGYEMNKLGRKILVDHGLKIDHVYIRNSKKHEITLKRLALRRQSDQPTRKYLENKYGSQWRNVIFPKSEKEITAFYHSVEQNISKMYAKKVLIDFDGVLTDGKIYFDHKGNKFFSVHSRDNSAIAELIFRGYHVIIVTANNDESIKKYAEARKCDYIYTREKDIESEIAIGDSSFDIPMLKKAKKAYCPADADGILSKYASVLKTKGGEGVISELIKLI